MKARSNPRSAGMVEPGMSLRPILAIAGLCVLPTAARAQQHVESGQRIQSTSRRIEIYDASGVVSLTRASGNSASIVPTAQGPDGSQLRFETDESGDRFRLRVVF